MAAIPTMEEEDAKRPHRERESLVAERTRIVNRMKGCLARLGIRTFKPTLQRATDLLPTLRTPEGTPLPPNALAEMSRDLPAALCRRPIREIEAARLERLNQAPDERSHAMVRLLVKAVWNLSASFQPVPDRPRSLKVVEHVGQEEAKTPARRRVG